MSGSLPAQDRLFLDGAAERRRFLDRLAFAAEPAHATAANAYDRALRERLRLLTAGPADPAWLAALETRLGEEGVRLAAARARTLDALQARNLCTRQTGPFLSGLARPLRRVEPSLILLWTRPRLAEALARARVP